MPGFENPFLEVYLIRSARVGIRRVRALIRLLSASIRVQRRWVGEIGIVKGCAMSTGEIGIVEGRNRDPDRR